MKKISLWACGILLSPWMAWAVQPGTWSQHKSNGIDYWLYVPRSVAGGPARLMLNMHGCGSTAKEYKELGNWEPAAERHRMVVAVPQVPDASEIPLCWDSLGRDMIQLQKHTNALVGMIEDIASRPGLRVRRNEIFASGHSAGATQAMVLACTRPDLISGVGLSAGLVIGASYREIFRPLTSSESAAAFCRRLAGPRAGHFANQTAVVLSADLDWIVNARHSELAVGALKEIYGAHQERGLNISSLPGTRNEGDGMEILDGAGRTRISYIVHYGLGHAWPAGNPHPPRPSKFIRSDSLNLPMYLGTFFSR